MKTPLQQYADIQPMVRKDAMDAANKVFDQKGIKPGRTGTVAHVHNNIDSPSFPLANLSDANFYSALRTTTLSTAQILALHSTPITLVPAQGLNTVTIVESIDARLVYKGTAYTGGNNLEFRYTNASGNKVTADMSSTFLDSSASAYDHVAGVTTELTPVANSPIVVCVPAANPAAGTSPITFVVKYRIISYAA